MPNPADVHPMPPMAGGQPLDEAVADRAAEWLTLLMSGETTDAERALWMQWRAGHPDHERAWAHIETVTGRMKAMDPRAAYRALSPYTDQAGAAPSARRRALNLLLWGGLVTGTGVLVSRTETALQLAADHRSATGERRTASLPDGTVVTLNTASAIDVRFDRERRLVRLVAGEVMVVTGHVDDTRPFIVETAEGHLRALGTRFTVRQWPDGRTGVAVVESAVEVTPAGGTATVLRAGQRTVFTRGGVEPASALGEADTAWTRGQILADQMRLDDFAAELARYRPGLLRCAPAVAGLRFSGVFPLENTDRILAALPDVLPVRVRQRTRYWVVIDPAS